VWHRVSILFQSFFNSCLDGTCSAALVSLDDSYVSILVSIGHALQRCSRHNRASNSSVSIISQTYYVYVSTLVSIEHVLQLTIDLKKYPLRFNHYAAGTYSANMPSFRRYETLVSTLVRFNPCLARTCSATLFLDGEIERALFDVSILVNPCSATQVLATKKLALIIFQPLSYCFNPCLYRTKLY
jgi:hypothetical protein